MAAPTSERLRYERLAAADVVRFHALAQDEYIARYLLDGERVPFDWAAEEAARSDELFERRGVGTWLLYEKPAPHPIGFAGFRVFPELDHEPQLLYALLEPFTHRGYGTEIARALVAYAREQRLEPIVSAADEPNLASRRVLEKAGFREAGAVPGAFGAIILYVHETSGSFALVGVERTLDVARTWDGGDLPDDERITLDLEIDERELRVAVDAPWHGDAPPPQPPGACPRLWEHEVVELFLLGDDERYVEVEMGPHGHFLLLALHGRRKRITASPQGMPMFYAVERQADRWRGLARIPQAWFPPRLARCNAYGIWGPPEARRYLAWQPVPGPRPDFHRLDTFARIDE